MTRSWVEVQFNPQSPGEHGCTVTTGSGCDAEFSSDVITSAPATRPLSFYLGPSVPNPFNPVSNITFGIKESGWTSLAVYDVSGQLVARLIDGPVTAGHHTASWDGTNSRGTRVASGVYFYRLVQGDQVQTRKAVLLK